nr:hypothetical protein CFP56_50843 [Quercus suber]
MVETTASHTLGAVSSWWNDSWSQDHLAGLRSKQPFVLRQPPKCRKSIERHAAPLQCENTPSKRSQAPSSTSERRRSTSWTRGPLAYRGLVRWKCAIADGCQ